MFGHIVATIIGLLVVVLSGTFVTIINPLVGIPFILCGIFLLLFPNFLSNKLFDRGKGTASVASDSVESPTIPRIETYKLTGVEFHTKEIQSLGTENPDYLLDREGIVAKQIGGENLYPYTFEPLPAELSIQGEEVAVTVQGLPIGIIGRNNGIVNAGLYSKLNDGINILCADIYASSILCHTAVTGSCKDFSDGLVFFQFLNNGMLTATAANNE